MNIANLNEKELGSFDKFKNKEIYPLEQFKSDFKDYQLHSELQKEKTNLTKKKEKIPNELKQELELTKQGYENFLALCIISGSTFFNKNIGKIKKLDSTKSLLSYRNYENSTENYNYTRNDQQFQATPDSVSFTLAVLNSMDRLEFQVNLTQKVSAWVNTIFWLECKRFLRPSKHQLGFHDKLLDRVKDIVNHLDSNKKLHNIKVLLEKLQINFIELKDGTDPIGFYLVKDNQKQTQYDFDLRLDDKDEHKINIIKINTILAKYKVKNLPSSEQSTAKNPYDQIHAARRASIFDNPTLVNIMKECSEALGLVLYSTLHESLKQRLSYLQFRESASLETLDFESKIESLNKEIYSDEHNEEELLTTPVELKDTSEQLSNISLNIDTDSEFSNDEEIIESTDEAIIESLELTTSLDIETEYNPEDNLGEDVEVDYDTDTYDTNSEEEASYENNEKSFNEDDYVIIDLLEHLSNKLEMLSNEYIDLYEDLELFVKKALEITNNPGKVKKVTQSTLDNEEYFKYERGKEYFERLEQELIYEDKIDPKDLSYKLGLIVTLKRSFKG